MQREDGLDAARAQCLDHPDVVLQGARVPGALLGLDPAPLDGETVSVVAKIPREIEVGFIQFQVPARIPRPMRQLS